MTSLVSDGLTDVKRKISSYIVVADNEEEESITYEESRFCRCPILTLKQRWYGFGICFVLGLCLSLVSIITVSSIVSNPERFVLLYITGSLISVASTCFIWNPSMQCKRWFKIPKIVATSIYLDTMILTLYLAFTQTSSILIISTIVLQYIAICWYVLSWLPYGRKMVRKCGCNSRERFENIEIGQVIISWIFLHIMLSLAVAALTIGYEYKDTSSCNASSYTVDLQPFLYSAGGIDAFVFLAHTLLILIAACCGINYTDKCMCSIMRLCVFIFTVVWGIIGLVMYTNQMSNECQQQDIGKMILSWCVIKLGSIGLVCCSLLTCCFINYNK